MGTVITQLDQVTPAWLTEKLRVAGVLLQGEVLQIDSTVTATNTATAMPICPIYSADAPESAPYKLFLKLGKRKPEVDFYHHILPNMTGIPVIRCYDAQFDDAGGTSHLLMDDMSETHAEPPDALPPPSADVHNIVDILAKLHAQWWEHPRLTSDLRPVLDDVPGYILAQAREGFPHFVDALGDRLSDKRRTWYERILAGMPLKAWQERVSQHKAVTLVHGDSHWWNFLFPKVAGEILVIDWAVWHLNLPTTDLAYTFGQLCFRDWRERFEKPLLEHYHQRLLEYGVKNYDWAQCWQNYRLMMVFHTLWPIFHHQWAPNSIWWRNMECCLSAFEDLNCEELL